MSTSRRVTLTKAQRSTPAGAELIALLAELSDDGMVTRDEMARLKAWLEVDRGVEFEACAFLYEVVDTIAADGEISEAGTSRSIARQVTSPSAGAYTSAWAPRSVTAPSSHVITEYTSTKGMEEYCCAVGAAETRSRR